MDTLHIGSQTEFVHIAFPASFSSEGWAHVNVELSVQGFRGSVQAFLERADLERFAQGLAPLYESLLGRAELSPLEAQITLVLSGNGRGAVTVSGFALSQASFANRLQFEFEVDQTYLPPLMAELQALLAKSGGAHA